MLYQTLFYIFQNDPWIESKDMSYRYRTELSKLILTLASKLIEKGGQSAIQQKNCTSAEKWQRLNSCKENGTEGKISNLAKDTNNENEYKLAIFRH